MFSKLHLEYTGVPSKPHQWILLEDFTFTHDGVTIVVPKGFETDLGSIPRMAWRLIAPIDVTKSSIVHDYLYSDLYKDGKRIGKGKRKAADDTFLTAMKLEGQPVWKAVPAYVGVRLFGGLFTRYTNWKSNK